MCVGRPANEKTDHNLKRTEVTVSHTEPGEMKETRSSEAFYAFDNGYVRRVLAVNYSFNLSGNPEEPILFLLSGDVRATAYCGAPSDINPGQALTENIAAERRRRSLGRTSREEPLTSSRAYLPAERKCTSVYSKTNDCCGIKGARSPFAWRRFSAANRK